MLPLLRALAAPLVSLVFLILASGLFNTFVSVRLGMEGYDNETIGAIVAALYAGLLAGSMWLGPLITKMGHLRSLILFAIASALFILAQAFWIDPFFWGALRFLGGACTAGVFIVIESWLLIGASPNMRGSILSIYLAIFYAALSLGQFLIEASDPMGIYPFLIAAALCICAVIPLFGTKITGPRLEKTSPLSILQLFKISPLGFLGGVVSGMLLAAVYGLVPVYAKEAGLSISQIGRLMAILIFGGLMFQWPMGYLADKGNRRRVLTLASFLTALTSLSLAFTGPEFPILLFFLAFVFGGFSFTIYPLSMAHACEKLEDAQIVPATGGFVLSYSLGAVAGPLLAPIAMDLYGPSGLFYFLGAISLFLVPIGLKKTVATPE